MSTELDGGSFDGSRVVNGGRGGPFDIGDGMWLLFVEKDSVASCETDDA